MLAWTIYFSFAAALALGCLPERRAAAARRLALLAALAGLAAAVAGALRVAPGTVAVLADAAWIPSLGIRYQLAADGLSVTLALLTGLAGVAGVLFSWNIERRTPEFFALYFALLGGVYGVFLSQDLFLLFVFYEIAIIPKYFLIAIWGSTRREYGAMKLALYSFAGSALVFAGMLILYVAAGARTMNLPELAAVDFPRGLQLWVFPLVFAGFGVLAGLWPFHTWAPTGHVAAPTAASMLLAGVVMKLGAYGCLRVAMGLMPLGLADWASPVLGLASWRELFALLAVAGIVYGALAALVQGDFKFVIGYSSVSHMGFVLLGLMTLQITGLSGAALQMFSHGIIAGLLFAVVGRMIYDRAHTRDLGALAGLQLGAALPFAAVSFTLAAAAAMGLPGFSGFVAELQVLVGAWRASPVLAVATGFGILAGVAYSIRVLQRAFFPGPAERAGNPPPAAPLVPAPITAPERLGAVLLITVSVAVGLFPQLLLRWIVPALHAPWFERLLQGGRL